MLKARPSVENNSSMEMLSVSWDCTLCLYRVSTRQALMLVSSPDRLHFCTERAVRVLASLLFARDSHSGHINQVFVKLETLVSSRGRVKAKVKLHYALREKVLEGPKRQCIIKWRYCCLFSPQWQSIEMSLVVGEREPMCAARRDASRIVASNEKRIRLPSLVSTWYFF